MKNLSIMLVAALAIGMSSCSGSDDDSSSTSGSLEGKWSFSKVGAVEGGHELLVDYPDNEDGCDKDYVQFSTGGAFEEGDYDSSDTPCALSTEAGTWVKTGTTLTVTYGTGEDAETETAEVLKLTGSQLKIKYVGGMEDGFIYVFSKQ